MTAKAVNRRYLRSLCGQHWGDLGDGHQSIKFRMSIALTMAQPCWSLAPFSWTTHFHSIRNGDIDWILAKICEDVMLGFCDQVQRGAISLDMGISTTQIVYFRMPRVVGTPQLSPLIPYYPSGNQPWLENARTKCGFL